MNGAPKLESPTDSPGRCPAAPLFALLSRVISMLGRSDYPRDGICSHHGLNFVCGDDNVGVTEHRGRLLVMIYRGDSRFEKKPTGLTEIVGYSRKEHEAKVHAVAMAAGCAVRETWRRIRPSSGTRRGGKLNRSE
jgi:hypothetical protein